EWSELVPSVERGTMPEHMLDASRLTEQAREATGLEDLDGTTWRDALERFVAALNAEARLNEIGAQVASGEILAHLASRLQVVEWHRQHPEIGRADIVPPIVIVGQGRTGTPILFDLLAQDPAHRVPLTWEVDRPFPPPESATYETDPRIAEVDTQLAMADL